MYTPSYESVVNFLADLAPSVEDRPGDVIRWAEPLCELLDFIYSVGYDQATEDLYEAVRESQGIEEEEEED